MKAVNVSEFPRDKSELVATISYLQSLGLSSRSVAKAFAIVRWYLTDHTDVKGLVGPTSVLSYCKDTGNVLYTRLADVIGKNKLNFCVSFDTMLDRSWCRFVSRQVAGQRRTLSSFNQCYWRTQSLWLKASKRLLEVIFFFSMCISIVMVGLEARGGHYLALAVDGPPTNMGIHTGVGVRLSKLFGRHIVIHSCWHHADALVLKVLAELWPRQMNVPSPTQWGYLTWYIINHGWEDFRAMLIQYYQSIDEGSDLAHVFDQFKGNSFNARKSSALSDVKKPLRPMVARWRTFAEILEFLLQHLLALSAVFERKRRQPGVGTTATSLGGMMQQWELWAASPKLASLLGVAVEFIGFWKKFNKNIDLEDLDFNHSSSHKTHQRSRFTLMQLEAVESILDSLDELGSRATTSAAYTKAADVTVLDQMYTRLYMLAKKKIVDNYSRYLSGVLLVHALADPEFALYVYEALEHFLARDVIRINKRTVWGLRLEKELRSASLNDLEQVHFDKLVTKKMMTAAWLLLAPLRGKNRNVTKFVESILTPGNNPMACWLNDCRINMSHTRATEASFSVYDVVMKTVGGGGKSKSVAKGNVDSVASVSSKVRIAYVRT
jgi:hypothetical protein